METTRVEAAELRAGMVARFKRVGWPHVTHEVTHVQPADGQVLVVTRSGHVDRWDPGTLVEVLSEDEAAAWRAEQADQQRREEIAQRLVDLAKMLGAPSTPTPGHIRVTVHWDTVADWQAAVDALGATQPEPRGGVRKATIGHGSPVTITLLAREEAA